MKTQTQPKPRIQKPENLRTVAKELYDRNMQMMNDYKATHPCSVCNMSYPAAMMHFVGKVDGITISELAGSRCSSQALTQAMIELPLVCAAHRPKVRRTRK